jgi:hypothetical protein
MLVSPASAIAAVFLVEVVVEVVVDPLVAAVVVYNLASP